MDVLKNAISGVMTRVLSPIISIVLEQWIDRIVVEIKIITNDILYFIIKALFRVLDTLETVAQYLLGIHKTVQDSDSNDILSMLLQESAVNNILGGFIVISFMLTFLFTLRRLASKIADETEDNKPFASLFKSVFKCWGRLGLTLFICMLLTNITRVTAISVAQITNVGGSSNMSNTIFVLGAVGAAKFPSGTTEETKRNHRKNLIKAYTNGSDYNHKYDNASQVWKDFSKYDTPLLFIAVMAVFALYAFLQIIFKLIRRLFNIVILYIIGPFFAAMSLLHGNEKKYTQWQSLFLANFVNVIFILVGLFAFRVISSNFALGDVKLYTGSFASSFLNSVLNLAIMVSMLSVLPDTVRFGYNLITDQGRFLANEKMDLSNGVWGLFGL